MADDVKHMKWWGWGEESISFTHEDKPGLAPFIKKHISLDVTEAVSSINHLDSFDVPPAKLDKGLETSLSEIVGSQWVKSDNHTRVVHSRGKSLRDLVLVRAGQFGRLPDVVVYPSSEEEVAAIVSLAIKTNAVLIPFGGGSNISGSVSAPSEEKRTVITVDMGRMTKVLEIDEYSQLARVHVGALGPDFEQQLNDKGFTFGHFPDSFAHSTLGGWIATRSSGMQSDKYGDISEIVRAVRVVTADGILVTRNVPSTSTGPSVREMILGSEGRLGIITEATVQVHKIADERVILAYLFPDWHSSLAAMRDIAASDATPIITRVSDANETRFSFSTRKKSSLVDSLKSRGMQVFLKRRKGFDLEKMCLSFIGYEGSEEHVKRQKSLVSKIVSQHGGLCIGSGPGVLYDQKKFDTPYIRDFLLDRGALADVSETSTPWATLEPLHKGIVERANKAFADIGVQGYIMCHMSHSYHSGACLYFTFAFKNPDGKDPIATYDIVKKTIQRGFMELGGTLSHHHAVGTEHQEWLEQDISAPGVKMVKALFDGVDPGKNFNPGKIIS